MNKFWKWVRNKAPDPDNPDETIEERTLFLDGTIASESWFDDDVTPALFKSELNSGTGDITVWINSPGGDCFAAAQIYNMLRDYAGKVSVKIDGIAASAASVIAMAGDTVLVSPVSMIMIHNPATIAMGDHNEMQKAIEMLDSVKDSIINAYALKTGLSHNKLAELMENETWMDAREAVKLGFADDVISRSALQEEKPDEEEETPDEPDEKDEEKEARKGKAEKPSGMLFSRRLVEQAAINKVADHYRTSGTPEPKTPEETGYRVDDCMKRLDLIKTFM
ncbi:MAG: head maturation protease, ClpP-related [Eubacterium sp.]